MTEQPPPATTRLRTLLRWALAGLLLAAGVGHLLAPEPFLAQTPTWLPARLALVYVSGVIEIALGLALLVSRRHRRYVGWSVAVFLVLVFPGNVHQAVAGVDAFGLDSAAARWGRLLLQPVLIVVALVSTRDPGHPHER